MQLGKLSIELILMLLSGRITPSQPGGGVVPAHPAIKQMIAAAKRFCSVFMMVINSKSIGYLDGAGGVLPPRFMYMMLLTVLMMWPPGEPPLPPVVD